MNLDLILITGSGFLGGLALWLGLLSKHKVSRISTRKLFTIILIVGLICRIAFSLFTPAFYAPDEQHHFKYVKYIAENYAFPVQTSHTDSQTINWEYYQPPLYYLSLTPMYMLSEILFHFDSERVRLLRGFSIVLWSVTVFFAFKFLNSLKVHNVFLQTFVVTMICSLPTYTFLSSVINNDNLLITIGSGILYFIVQPTSFKNSLLLGILLGLALLTKLTAVVYIALILLIPSVRLIRKTVGRAIIPHIFLQTGIATLIWAPWAWRNYNLYDSITAEGIGNVLRQWKTVHQAFTFTLEYMQESFWAVSGIYNNIFFYPIIGRYIFYFACIGLLYGFFFKRDQLMRLVPKDISIIIALALVIVINVILVFRFGLLYGQGQGRFLFPLLIPLSLFIGIGLRIFSIFDTEKSPIHLIGFLATYAISFTLYSLVMFTEN